MRISMIIPTYWGRAEEVGWQEGDAVYDHPTPIDQEGTLGRTLESIKILNNKEFKLIIPICPTTDDVEQAAEAKVKSIIKDVNLDVETYIFTQENLRKISKLLLSNGLENPELLSLKGYSNVRNMCIYAAQLVNADIAILIDDDEVFENPRFVDMAIEHIGKRRYGNTIYGVAGYYLNKYDEFYDDVDIVPWMTYWNRFGSKTEAFDKIIGDEPRIKITPFAFGGAMVIHKNLFQLVPFDPKITRGEDIDYLINSKMFGYDFFLDNELNIKHLPPSKNHPVWKRFREDIYRFLFEKAKIQQQKDINYITSVSPEDFDPYPGEFLKQDLEDKIFKTNVLLAMEYLSEGDIEGARESIKNVYLSKYEASPKIDVFDHYIQTQNDWTDLINLSIKLRRRLRKIVESNNLSTKKIENNIERKRDVTLEDKVNELQKHSAFSQFNDDELRALAKIGQFKIYEENDVLFRNKDTRLCVFAVIKGCVRVVSYNSKNEEIILGSVCSNSILGETTLMKEQYNSTGIAEEFVEVIRFSKDSIEEIIDNNPILGNKILQVFLDKIYHKLHNTNKLYQEKILQEEHIEE